MGSGMKIGVLGGTFDPVHLGHIAIARAAVREYQLDRFWFMPAGDPYFKEGCAVTSPALRFEMTKACLDALPDAFECSDFELRDAGRTYSAVTFQKLHALYPDDRFYFVMGLDSLSSLEKWYEPELLLRNAVILCASRNDDTGPDTEAEHVAGEVRRRFAAADPDIRVIHTPEIDISSTMIRSLVYEGKDISGFVTQETEMFIREHGLYRDTPLKRNKTH